MADAPEDILLVQNIALREVLTGLIAMIARQSGDGKFFVDTLKAEIDGTRNEVLSATPNATQQHREMGVKVTGEVERIFQVFKRFP